MEDSRNQISCCVREECLLSSNFINNLQHSFMIDMSRLLSGSSFD